MTLHEIHLPPVVAGVKAGALGFMAAYNDIDSVPCCASPWLLQEYLRDELGFDGIVMADGLAVDRLVDMAGSIPLRDVPHCWPASTCRCGPGLRLIGTVRRR